MLTSNLQASFIGGEISPSLQARTDVSAYHTWLDTAQNMIVHPQGGISNRPGTQYVGTAKRTDIPCRLIPFTVSTDESYVLEMGECYIRIYTANGLVLNTQGEVLEVQTPYLANELSALHYTQYNQTLYIAHVRHALHRLVRTAPGKFTWEEVPLIGGPFAPVNEDLSKKMRLTEQTTTVISEGVSASLTFQPVAYPDLMVWGFFEGDWFYASEDYGLNVPAIVQAFNTAYGEQGFSARDLGGLIEIKSAAATGGDGNGKTLVLEYRRSFVGSPTHTVSQVLHGGENAGTQTVSESGRYILESNASYFTPSHVGGKFCVIHNVDAQYQSGTLGYEATSYTIKSGSDWNLRTSGTWTGTLTVQVSQDLGQTWRTVKTLSRAAGEDNFYLTGNLNDTENLFYVRVCSGTISGEAGYELSADSFVQRAIVKVLSYVSATQVVVACERAYGSNEWTSQWAESSFSPAAGYPTCVFCFHDRLGLAATDQEAQTLWLSKTGKFSDFGQARDTLLDTDALSIRLAGGRLDAIEAVINAGQLLIFTAGGEWGLSCNGACTLDHLKLEMYSAFGSAITAPIRVGGRVLFTQARGGILRDFYYDQTSASYVSDDLTLRTRHLFQGRNLVEMAFAEQADPLLWGVMSDGELVSLTYLAQQGIYAWTHHQTQGKFISVCNVVQEGQDEVWFVVQRHGKYLIERLRARTHDTNPAAQQFLDASVSYLFSTPQTQLTGLTHLNGQMIDALCDGNVVKGLQVTDGKITLPSPASQVCVGLSYTASLRTLPLADIRHPRRMVSVGLYMLNSRGGDVGISGERLIPLVQRTDEVYNTPIRLQTGRVVVSLAGRSDFSSRIVIKQTDPLPLTLLAIDVKAV